MNTFYNNPTLTPKGTDYQKLKESYEIKINLLLLNELKKRTSLLSCIACLFYNIGDFKHAESAYILYIKLIEINYGNSALETSNCYFLIGVFYIENKYFKRAMACIKRSTEIRQNKLGILTFFFVFFVEIY